MNDNKRYIGTFHSERALLDQIHVLKTQGFGENDMYVVANNDNKVSMVRGQTDVDLTSPEHTSWIHKFKSYFTGEEPVRGALSGMGFSDVEADKYYREAENGGILLFVDREDLHETRITGKGTADYKKPVTGADHRVNDKAMFAGDPNLKHRVGGEAVLNRETEVDRAAYNKTRLNKDIDGKTTTPLRNKIGMREREDGLLHNREREEKLRLHEERLNVDKRMEETGEVHVNKHVETEKQSLDIPVKREEVHIERRPVNETVTGDAKIFDDGENIHIPVKQEHVEVTKKPVVNEEIVVGKKEVEDTKHIRETVRHEEADIERRGDTNEANAKRKLKNDRDPLI